MFWKSLWSSVLFSLSWRVLFVVLVYTLVSYLTGSYAHRLGKGLKDAERTADPSEESAKNSPGTGRAASRFFLVVLIRLFLLAVLIAMLAPSLLSGGGLDFMGPVHDILLIFLVAILAFSIWNATALIPLIGETLWDSDYVRDFAVGILMVFTVAAGKGYSFRFSKDEAILLGMKLLLTGGLSILLSMGVRQVALYVFGFGSAAITDYEWTMNAQGELVSIDRSPGVTRVLVIVLLVITIWSRLFPIFWTSYYMMSQLKQHVP
jgi:hypothetical protein